MSMVARSTEPSARCTNARAVRARASQIMSSARRSIVTAGRSASSASWCRPSVHSARASRIRTRPASRPLACRTARSKAASPERVRPENTSARPSVASTSASRSGEPASPARRTAVRSSRTATPTSPKSRRTMPMAWCAIEASYGSGSAASTARARASASFGRDSASGSRSRGGAMAAARRPSRQPATRTDAQVRLIHDAFNGADPPIRIKEVRFTQGPKEGEVDFLCEDGVILARTEDAVRVTEVLLRQTAPRRRPDLRLPGATNGVVRLTLEGTAFDDVIRALEAIDAELGVGVATPNHVLSITPVTGCPATEPEEVDPAAIPDPGVCPSGGNGARVLVHVLDTGLVDGAATDHSWLGGVTGDLDPVVNGQIESYTGHGTFIAGVARCMAPATEVFVRAAF